MCNFFSLVSDGKGEIMYFDWKLRKKCLSGELGYNLDSHTSIADYFGYKGKQEDKLNKYEYNPLTKLFTIDQINTEDDSEEVKKFCKQLDFKKIVPQLIIKDIINVFEVTPPKKITEKHIKLLREWDSIWEYAVGNVGDSVRDGVRDGVRGSVWSSVRNSVKGSAWSSVEDSVWDIVWSSVWEGVRDKVWDIMWESVRNSTEAYISSFFNLPKWKYMSHKKGTNPYQCLIDLWEQGLLPSYDGKIWRLHGGRKGKVLWKGKIKRR